MCVSANLAYQDISQSANIANILKGNIKVVRILFPTLSYNEVLEEAYDWTIDDIFFIFHDIYDEVVKCYKDGVSHT